MSSQECLFETQLGCSTSVVQGGEVNPETEQGRQARKSSRISVSSLATPKDAEMLSTPLMERRPREIPRLRARAVLSADIGRERRCAHGRFHGGTWTGTCSEGEPGQTGPLFSQ
mmetsp:Transcript_20557/g.43013  ORF Transcript_20557/g.43013 Transcript_20557/m.43013 type:complete len:114 (-) Transcript_20557:573-914(-)